MVNYRKRLLATTAAVALAAGLAACGGGSDSDSPSSDNTEAGKAGGTLVLRATPPTSTSTRSAPTSASQLANFSRTVYRQLVAFPISTDPDVANTPVPDLATDTGTSTEDGKVWRSRSRTA